MPGLRARSPAWFVEAFGEPPAAGPERISWERRAGAVAAHRELTGHDDPDTAIGAPPKPGQVEAYASWRSAWTALGRPESDRDELELSEGQLRVRVRAYEREKTWAPRYVANELAGTRRAAETHRETAALRTAEAATAGPDERADLQQQAAEAAALAATLDQRAAELQVIDDARARWLAHTAGSRVVADRAADELANRHAAAEAPEPEVTAEEWLDAHDDAMRAEDLHREITELADERDDAPVDEDAPVETYVADVREVAAMEPVQADEDAVRVATAQEAAVSIRQAQRSLAEIEARTAAEAVEEAEHSRAEQLGQWHDADEQAVEVTDDDAFVDVR